MIFVDVPTSCTIVVKSPKIVFVKVHLRIIRYNEVSSEVGDLLIVRNVKV